MEKKIKIFLCDFVHNYIGVGSYMFPLNIGYIAAWTEQQFPNTFDITLFKYPDKFLNHCKKEQPDIVGFANYSWNTDLNNQVSQWVKQHYPQAIVVYGGPNIDYSEIGGNRFFTTNPAADFYVPYQGELPWEQLLKRITNEGLDLTTLQLKPIDGVVFYDRKNNQSIWGEPLSRIEKPDVIPSPYLTGLLDSFFDTNLIPIAETNRGCPYSCTYCCQCLSSHNQIEFFSLDRVKKELRYITDHVKNTNILLFADSNFGIKERDINIAKYLAKLTKETGYPHKVSMNWAKNQPKLYDIGEILNNINLVISLQSMDKTVLKNIKRHNIKLSIFKDILQKINQQGGMSGTELILGLPGETTETHMNAIRELFNWNVSYIICYNCLILEGSELSLMREQGTFDCKTKFRLIDNS